MTKKNRLRLSHTELEESLREQILLLIHACKSFDSGFEAIGKHIAIILRVLLHNTRNSKALLDQLGFRNIKYYDSAGVVDPQNLLNTCNLVSMRIQANIGGKYIPKFQFAKEQEQINKIQFAKWWNNYVYKDDANNFMHRRDLILNVADTDGGGHVDPELDELYYAFSKKIHLVGCL